jgi:hypothetical protein
MFKYNPLSGSFEMEGLMTGVNDKPISIDIYGNLKAIQFVQLGVRDDISGIDIPLGATQALWFNGTGEDESTEATRTNQQPGRCYDFDGTDDNLGLTSSIDLTGDMTISFWMNPDDLTTKAICGIDANTTSYMRFDSSTVFRSRILAGAFSILTHGHTFTTGELQHFMMVRESGVISIYRNIEAPTTTDTLAGTFRLDVLMSRNANADGFDGKIFDYRIYDKALNQSEREYVYTFGKIGTDPSTSNLLVQYKCDDTHLTTAYDSSSNGNNGAKNNITASSFHYEGSDVPYSFQNEVGFSNLLHEDGTFIADVSGTGNDIKFKIKSTSTKMVLLTVGATSQGWIIAAHNGSTNTVLSSQAGTPTIKIDGSIFSGNRGLMQSTLCDGVEHDVEITNINFTNALWSSGIHMGGYTGADFGVENTVIKDFFLNGEEIELPFIPRDESDITKDIAGEELQHTGRVQRLPRKHSSNCGNFDGVDDYIDASHLSGSETVLSSGGTSTPTIIAGQIDFTAGTCWDLVLSDGTHYPLAEGAGATVYDVSGNDNHSTATNITESSFWDTQDVYHYNFDKGFTNIATFDGVDDYVETGISGNCSSFDISASFITSSAVGVMLLDTRLAFNSGGIILWFDATGNLKGRINTGSSSDVTAGTGWDDGVAHTARLVWDGLTLELFVDGVSQDTVSKTGTISGSGDIWLCENQVGLNGNFHGQIWDVSIALDGVLEAQWLLNEGVGTTAYDTSGNGNDITLSNITEVDFWGLKIPALADGTETALGGTINNPAVAGHNNAETQIDFTGGIDTPWSNENNVETNYVFGATRVSPNFKTIDSSTKESQFYTL